MENNWYFNQFFLKNKTKQTDDLVYILAEGSKLSKSNMPLEGLAVEVYNGLLLLEL